MPSAVDGSCSEMTEPLAERLYGGHGHPVWFGSIALLLVTGDLCHEEAEKDVEFAEIRILHCRQPYGICIER